MLSVVNLQPAYVLHSRAYRDTSALLEIFALDYGRVSLVARGVKGTKARYKGLLQPFVPLLMSWQGKGELMTLRMAEPHGIAHNLMGNTLLCGLYLNELLVKLLHRYDAHPELFLSYQQTLIALQEKDQQQIVLRLFEKNLLTELGYALQLEYEAITHQPIDVERFYFFNPTQGLLPCLNPNQQPNVFQGENLLAIHNNNFAHSAYMRDAKRLIRIALNHLLEGKTIRSRELFF